MGLQAVPLFIGEAAFLNPVENDRNLLEFIFQRTGAIRPGHMVVTPTGTARQVSVSSGGLFLLGAETSTQGGYIIWSDAAETFTFAAAVGNPRIDTLVARAIDEQYGSDPGISRAELEIVQGVAAGSPVARADSYFNSGGGAYKPGAWYRLADVRINLVDGVLPAGQITQSLRYTRTGGWTVCTSTTRPSDAVVGDRIYETDTGFIRIFDGTNWPYNPGTIIKRGWNTANKQWTSGGAVPYTRLDSIEIVANQEYIVHVRYYGSVGTSGDSGQVNLYVSTSGSATTSSTQHTFNVDNASGAFVPAQTSNLQIPYSSATNVTASFLIAVGKAGGTGTYQLNGATMRTEIWVEARGPVLPNTAVAL